MQQVLWTSAHTASVQLLVLVLQGAGTTGFGGATHAYSYICMTLHVLVQSSPQQHAVQATA